MASLCSASSFHALAAEVNRLTNIDIALVGALTQCAKDFENIENRLFLLARAAQFAKVGKAFE